MNSNTLTTSAIKFDLLDRCDRSLLLRDLDEVSHLYPNFEGWLTFKFLGNLASGKRKLIVAHNGYNALGYALLKQDSQESKICTFYVLEGFRGQGVGFNLMQRSMEVLDSEETFITVSDERLKELSPLLQAKGFELSSSVPNMYRVGSKEHIWTL